MSIDNSLLPLLPPFYFYFLKVNNCPMSEKVFLNLERMLPELEDYKERGLFDKNELQKIVETRKKHESRLQRVDKKLLDFIRYIDSETSLEKIRDKRLRKFSLKRTYQDTKISKRVVMLYKNALEKFNEKNLIVDFTEYAKKKQLVAEMKDVYAHICLKNPLDVDLWIYCASSLFEVDDIDGARALFFKGIRMNPSSMEIRKEFFRMEVLFIEKFCKEAEGDDDEDEIQRGDVPYNIFLDTMNVCRDEETLQEMLKMSKGIEQLTSRIEEELMK